jgi:hypothetical protein
VSGRRPVTQAEESFPAVLLGPLSGAVEEELPVHGVADAQFERPQRFFLGLSLGYLALELGATLGMVVAQLGYRGDVDGVVEPAVAAPVQPAGDPPPEDTSMGAVSLYMA